MYSDPVPMAQSYLNLINWIIRRLEERAAMANLPVTETHHVDDQEYTYRLTALGGFFIILVSLPEDWTDQQEPVALVFSFKDLYLLGFLEGGVWRLFTDADLTGNGDDLPGAQHSPLKFPGGYQGSVMRS